MPPRRSCQWLSPGETSEITRVRPLTTNLSGALVKTPKLFWTDCGVAASLAGIKSSTEVRQRLDAGFWLEQTLFQTLQTWRALEPQRRRLHFWRDRPGHEVDFILEQDGDDRCRNRAKFRDGRRHFEALNGELPAMTWEYFVWDRAG